MSILSFTFRGLLLSTQALEELLSGGTLIVGFHIFNVLVEIVAASLDVVKKESLAGVCKGDLFLLVVGTLQIEYGVLLVALHLLARETLHHLVLQCHVGVVLAETSIDNTADLVAPLHLDQESFPSLLMTWLASNIHNQ